MTWQKCPLCEGKGSMDSIICPTCDGRRIINEYGMPPEDKQAVPQEVASDDINEVFKPMSALDEITDEEIQYWSTPYYDELQAKKERRVEVAKEDADLRS